MLSKIVDFSIRFRVVVVALAALLVAYGVYVAYHAKLDVFPDFVSPQASIQTEAPGLSAEQVEALVTRPVESALSGVSSLESIRSQSIQGLSVITVYFREGTEIFVARQMLNERLSEIRALPAGVQTPRLRPITSSTMDLLKIGLVCDKLTPMELRTFADWTVKPRLLAVQGVAGISIYGGDVRQLQIRVRPDRLAAFNLSLDDVLAAARNSTGVRGAGFAETPAQRIPIQTEGQSLTPEQLGEVVVRRDRGVSLRLKDVADVVVGAEPKFGDCVIMGRSGVLLTMLSQYGANTMEVTRAVEAALEEMKPALAAQGITLYPRLHRPATFIETAIGHMRFSLLLGGILVAAVLFLFLFNLRAAFISLTAIPLSLLVAVIILDYFGVTLNTITLGGLAIAIGEVVDDAIIDVENILRRLRENAAGPQPRSPLAVVFQASLEVRSAVVYATFVVALVFLPVLTMSGLQGRLFAPLGAAYILAIAASLVVALTLTPALSLLLLPQRADRAVEPAFIERLKERYRRLLARIGGRPRMVIVSSAILCVLAAGLFFSLGGEFLPEFREGHFVCQVSGLPGTSLPEMMRIGKQATNELLKLPEIDTVEQQVGRAELGEDPWGPHRSELHIELKPTTGKRQDLVQNEIREVLSKIPGINFEVLTFLGDRISETITGETSSVVVSLFGDDLDVLDANAEEVARVLSSVRGAVDVRVSAPPGIPQTIVQLRPDRLRQFGFQPVGVLDALQTAYQGTTTAQVYEGNRVFDVVVIMDPSLRQDPEQLGSFLLRNSEGAMLRLDQLADVTLVSGRFMILHDDARRRQTITCNIEGRDLASFVGEAKAAAAKLHFPPGVYAQFGGTAELREQAQSELLLHSGLAGLGILILLWAVFRNGRNLLLVLANLPFALVGGVLAAFVTGGNLSLGSLVGFVTLFGISTRNSIMMISHFEHLVTVEGQPWSFNTALRGASERVLPVVMTALVTGLGLLPIALGTGEPGREIEGPMAVVILGGLITSTILNLLVLPTLAIQFGSFRQQPADARP
ncbi:MAG TPA: efflux RND transporter permease subunit [Phycisphaerae bacterium]|nr:efflux RND transporter permease subunit [Phycisphaerae bacterium]